jgi:hypothetical protein
MDTARSTIGVAWKNHIARAAERKGTNMENAVKEMFSLGDMFKENNEKIKDIQERYNKELKDAFMERLGIIKRHEVVAMQIDGKAV